MSYRVGHPQREVTTVTFCVHNVRLTRRKLVISACVQLLAYYTNPKKLGKF